MRGLVEEIEQAAYRAWTHEEHAVVGTWSVRASNGLSRRLNSAEPVDGASVGDLIADLEACRAWLAQRKLPFVIRATPLRPVGIDAALLRHGFREEGETYVMTSAVSRTAVDHPAVVGAVPSDGWVDAQLRLKGADSASAAWMAVLDRVPQPAAFTELFEDEAPIGAGLGVLGGTMLGVFDVNVARDRRRLGHGRRLMEVLHAWAAARGGTHSYLQVQADNVAGLGLYRSLGYEAVYRYHYLRERGKEIGAGGVGEASAEGES